MLKEEVEYRHTKQTELAGQMGISYKILNDTLNGRRPLTTPTALLFEAAVGIDAGLLMCIQLDYNLQTAKKDLPFKKRMSRVRKMAAGSAGRVPRCCAR